MENINLTWQFVLKHPTSVYLVPAPWHLPVLLVVLGLLSALGIHHLLGTRYGLYRVRERQDPLLAVPSLVVLSISVLAILAAYLVGSYSRGLIHSALRTPQATESAHLIGQVLLEPAFGTTATTEGTVRGMLTNALSAVPHAEFRDSISKRLQQTREVMASQQPTNKVGLPVIAPENESSPPPAAGSSPPDAPAENPERQGNGEATAIQPPEEVALPDLELVVLALNWAVEPDQEWPEEVDFPQSMQRPAEGDPDSPNVEEPFARQTGDFPLAALVTGLVEEIREGTALDRIDWEHIAGSRFLDWVLEPVLLSLINTSLILLVVLVVIFNLVFFVGIALAQRWFGTIPTAGSTSP